MGWSPALRGLAGTLATGVAGKQVELLKEAIPGISRVAALWNPDNPVHTAYLREAEAAARDLKLQPHRVKARGAKDYDEAFLVIEKVRAQALLVSGDPIFLEHRVMIAELSARKRLPAMYARREHVDSGGLIAYGTDRIDIMRRVAVYVDKILKGAKPADLPVEQPTKFDLVINLKTAKALGLTIPQSVLARADHVVE
jgi:putative ABC transport system substrate-binding protein